MTGSAAGTIERAGEEPATPRLGGVARIAGPDAVTVKKSAAASRAELTREVRDLERAQAGAADALARQRTALEAEFARRRAELEAQLAPLRKQVAQLREVMWTVDLYLGRDEELHLIRAGRPAPADTPITIRQKVLVMAEESLVLMDRKLTGMTAEDIDAFVDWLLEDPEHLHRVLPEQRGVVVMIPTRVETRSGNMFEDAARDAANQVSWWLLRNGERLYLLTVDPALRVTQRVLPRRREFVEVFDMRLFGHGRFAGEPLTPGSDEWMAMEEVADARQRHYMRIMLVLQGIIDRTPVWRPLPASGVNLMSLKDQDAGKIVLLQDDEPSIQLGDGRASFRDWQRRLNRRLRPGLRVIGDWRCRDFQDLRERGHRGHPRLSPATVDSLPEPTVPHLIEERRDGGFAIRYERSDQVWRRDVPVPGRAGYVYSGPTPVAPSRRASCVVLPGDSWVLPFDLVTVEELEQYLASRDDRSSHFLSMVPTIKAALAAKRAEAAAEGPFRDLLTRLLVDDGADPDAVARLTDGLVHWWKLANTWSRPLNGAPDHEAQAVRDILAEHQARRALAADDRAPAMVRAGQRVAGAICLARTRTGQWLVYAPSTPAHDERVFLDVTTLRRDGSAGATRTWQTVSPRSANLLQVAWSSETWNGWNFAASRRWYLTGPERETLIAEVLERAGGLPICVTEVHDPRQPDVRALVSYAWTRGTPEDTPVRLTDSPLSWHRESRGDQRLVTARAWAVGKTKDGVHVDGTREALEAVNYPTDFSSYSSGSHPGGTPWWPDDAHDFGDARPRLVWSDTTMLDRVESYVQRCRAAEAEQRRRRAAHSKEVDRYVGPVLAVIRDEMEAVARARFVEDFGADAMDLWPAHLKSLGHTDPIHARILWRLVAIALEHGHPVVGQTLDALAEFAWQHRNQAPGEWYPGRGRVDLAGYGHVVVPEPPGDATPVAVDDRRGDVQEGSS